jgi:tetraacyldisaccharide 4'-kinase
VSGIARPGRFHALLERLGCVLGGREVYRDHHRFETHEIRELEQRALRDGLRLVTTAKDEVRLLPLSREAPWFVVEIAPRVDGGWDGLLERLGEEGERGGRG